MKHFTASTSTGAAYTRWGADQPVTDEMRLLMDSVAAHIARGVFYTRDMHAAILAEYDFTAEELARGRGHVEGGVVGMDIYYARQRLEQEQATRDELAARERLALKEGDILPTLKINVSGKGARVIRKAKVTAVGARIAFDATLGGRRFSFTASANQIENGIRVASRDRL